MSNADLIAALDSARADEVLERARNVIAKQDEIIAALREALRRILLDVDNIPDNLRKEGRAALARAKGTVAPVEATVAPVEAKAKVAKGNRHYIHLAQIKTGFAPGAVLTLTGTASPWDPTAAGSVVHGCLLAALQAGNGQCTFEAVCTLADAKGIKAKGTYGVTGHISWLYTWPYAKNGRSVLLVDGKPHAAQPVHTEQAA